MEWKPQNNGYFNTYFWSALCWRCTSKSLQNHTLTLKLTPQTDSTTYLVLISRFWSIRIHCKTFPVEWVERGNFSRALASRLLLKTRTGRSLEDVAEFQITMVKSWFSVAPEKGSDIAFDAEKDRSWLRFFKTRLATIWSKIKVVYDPQTLKTCPQSSLEILSHNPEIKNTPWSRYHGSFKSRPNFAHFRFLCNQYRRNRKQYSLQNECKLQINLQLAPFLSEIFKTSPYQRFLNNHAKYMQATWNVLQ